MQFQQFLNFIPYIDRTPSNQINQVLDRIRQSYKQFNDPNLAFVFFKLSQTIMRLKAVNPQIIDFLEECIKDIIKISIRKNLFIGGQALRNIFNAENQYYKHNRLDMELKYPLGLKRLVYNYFPQQGEQCDIVKPYLSSSMYCGWTRGTVISKEGKRYIIKYANTQLPCQTKQQPLCAPLGTRTEDFDWRMNLQIGQQVDAYHKVWYRGTIIQRMIQNNVIKVRITFKVYSQNGKQVDLFGQRYDGLNNDQDQVYDVLSYRIQKPGKMSKKFCSYSLVAEQFIIDDTYDIIFQQEYLQSPFYGIMRLNFCKSQSILGFYETFCQEGGNQVFLNIFNTYNKEQIDNVINIMIVIANSSFLIPRMKVYDFLPQMLNKGVNFLYENAKYLNPARNQMTYFFIDVIAKRIVSLSQKHNLVNQIRKKLILECIKMNMQKQMLALRLLYEFINPMPRKYNQEQIIAVNRFLVDNQIFYKIIQPNIHEQILLRSAEFIKYLLQNNLISFKQIEYLWNIFPPTDVRGRGITQKMIGDISKAFSIEYNKKIINKILQYKQSELTIDNLILLKQLKDHKQLTDDQKLKILEYLWQIITLKSSNLTSNIQQEIQKVFKTIFPTLKDLNIKLRLLNSIINRLKQIKSLKNQLDILKQFIQTYPKKSNNLQKIEEQNCNQTQIPQNIPEIISILKSRNIYQIVVNLFNQLKNNDRMKNILKFTLFLFEHDQENVNQIAKIFYQKMGPSQEFLQWGQHITNKAHNFFIQMFQNYEGINRFQSITNAAFQALKAIIFDLNIAEGNLKLVKKTKGMAIQAQTTSKSVSNLPVQGPAQKPQTITFLYLLKSPYECKGIKFLQELLCVIKNNKVYDQIIKLIIQFFVNLDQSIQDRTQQFRQQFLMDIINNIQNMVQRNQFNEKNKLKLEISINLLQTLFSQTQKQGLKDIKPHFQCVQGQKIKVKVENQMTNNKLQDTKLQLNENITLYSLKKRIAQVYNQNPNQINVYKFVNPIADQMNGKSISDLYIYNEQTLKVMRKSPKQLPRKQLLNQTGELLSPKFNQIVQKWFNLYKNTKNQMGIQQLKNLSSECWRGSLLREVNKLNDMLKKYDTQNKGYLNLQDFKKFFIVKASQNPSAVWKIINLSGYKNNLRSKDEPQNQIDSNIFPRRILSTKKVYQVIFNLLQNKNFQPVHLSFYRLLLMLQTDTNLKEQLQKHVKSLIQNQISLYKLSYILETVLSQIHSNNKFFINFYKLKGCQFIYHKLNNFMVQKKSIYTFDTFIKTIIMPNMIKILNSYIICLHSQNKLIKYVQNNKINHLQIDFLSTQINKIDENISNNSQQTNQKINELKKIQLQINLNQFYDLTQKIFFNLIMNFNSDLLQKLTNETVRIYCVLSLILNQSNTQNLINGLKSQSLNFRRACQNLIYLYLINNKGSQKLKYTLNLLLNNLPTESKSIYSYFFTLLQKVLEMYLQLKKNETDDTQFIQLTQYLFNKLLNQLPNENRNALLADKLLVGVLVVLNIILIKREGVRKAFKNKKKQLLQKCLFFYNSRQRINEVTVTPQMLKTQKQSNHFLDYVKCKSEETRKILMEIIFHLHESSANQDPYFIENYIIPILNDLPQQKRKFQTKTLQVGLNNLGSTCYLNSMLQVLNFIQPFRNGIMRSKNQNPLIRQLKNLFSYLFFSERQDYVPEQLLKAFVPPITKGIQQDTTQFLNILFDQVQECLKNQPQKNLLEQIFQGTQAAQMICHACNQKRQRQEHFFTYGVQIEGKYDLKSALEGMYSGQLISDCLCQYCGQRADTTKRTVLDRIPNIFFVHLKRIAFNYDIFMNTKIHTRLQFPLELNIEPYSKQGIELRQSLGVQYLKNLQQNELQKKVFEQKCLHGKDKNFYKLKLKGIIVHSGGPDVGHYWCAIKRENSWLKFDDSKVSVFPHSSIQNQCFGGNFTGDQWGGMGSSSNAYVLIYQKQLKSDIVLRFDNNKQVLPYEKFQTYNTPQIYKQVWLDNHSLMLQNQLFKQSYCRQFLNFLVKMLKITPSNNKIQVISQVLYKICYHSGQTGKLLELFIQNTLYINPDIFRNYILADRQRTFDLLFHNNANVREFTAVYIQKVLLQTYKKGSQQDKTMIIQFINEYLFILHNQAAKNWLRIDGYFKLFQGLVINSNQIIELYNFFIQKHLIAYFIDFIMQKASPINIYPKKYSIGTKSNPANFSNAINLILFLYLRSYGMTGQNYQLPPIHSQYLYHLSDQDVLCLSSLEFYEKMFKQRQNLQYLGSLIQNIAIKNLPFSEAIARIMLSSLNQITDAKDQMIDICQCITKFLVITDDFWINRAQFVLGYSSPYIFNNNLLSSLQEQRFVFYSTLQDLFPIECLFAYCHINRLRNPLAVLHILKSILQSCVVSQQAKKYLLSQKSPTYCHERYLNWVKPYINNVLSTLNLKQDKKQALQKEVQLCNHFIKVLQEVKQPINNIITGKIINSNVVDRFQKEENSIQVIISNVQSYTLISQPTGQGNASLDKYLQHGRLNKKLTSKSNIHCLFKQFSKPLAIKQAQQQAQDKQIQSLFDDVVQKKPQQQTIVQKMQVQSQPKQLQIITQKIEVQQPQIIEEINIPQITLSEDYFRKIQIINNSNKTKKVLLKFHKTQNSNVIAPSKIHFVSSKKAVETMWICKDDPKKGWGIIDYQLIVEDKDKKVLNKPKWFKIYGNMNVQKCPQKIQVQAYSQHWEQNLNVQNNIPQESNINQVNCPICTMLNLSTASNCQVCGSNLF